MSVEERKAYLKKLRDQLLKQRESERAARLKAFDKSEKDGQPAAGAGAAQGPLQDGDIEHKRKVAQQLKEEVARPGQHA